ncbi:Vacuolar protein-sorting-associated protein 36 [Erysiphe neolycopersici]|uniref:Vacuolar protein-sorting-associated protein 36 n=1 Tax=Erysiphe neolycopersici TaxID=212602 RepID=A0A420HV80_9PEZI|nr:Vacuolar protein-sorting-associated protein 36 [Erysiphe neolycopersici]
MFLKYLDLTSALRPALLPGEVLLFTQDNVGLYEDKHKLENYQNGQVYLTSHRICYIDNLEPRKNCLAIELKDVERYEFYGGFLKSSPKIILVPKPEKHLSSRKCFPSQSNDVANSRKTPSSQIDGINYHPTPVTKSLANATWICPICTFSNLIPPNFDPATANERTPVTPCSTCGVKPSWAFIFKAAISNATCEKHISSQNGDIDSDLVCDSESQIQIKSSTLSKDLQNSAINSFQCPRCTFLNHPSLIACELCNAPLMSKQNSLSRSSWQADSTGCSITSLALHGIINIKISFRGGGEKIFLERLKGSMIQRKWLLLGAPPVPISGNYALESGLFSIMSDSQITKAGGIAGLEARRLHERQKNERIIGSAFEDLEALMSSAQEIIALAESFASTNENLNTESNAVASALGLVTTKEMLGNKSESLYITELTRNLTEFLTDDARGILSSSGGIISLVDLWAKFNRARGGVELVSPNDFAKATNQWESLKLPFRLRRFKSGVLIVQGNEHTDQKIITSIKLWLKDFHTTPPEHEVAWDWRKFGRGVTAEETAERFCWSIGVAEEELEMVEEEGTICREDGIEGTRFWTNYLNI